MNRFFVASAILSAASAPLLWAAAVNAAPGEGVRMGSFIVQPSIEVQQRFDDNIFQESGTATNTTDTITQITPQVTLRSDWNRHSLGFLVGLDADFHWDSSDDNSIDVTTRAEGAVDISRNTQLRIGGGYERSHTNRGDVNVGNNAAEPGVQNGYDGRAELSTKFNRLSLAIAGDAEYKDFQDIDLGNGVDDNEDDRDHVVIGGDLRIGFEARKGYEVFVFGRVDDRNFSDAIDDVNIRRGSTGYRVRAGVAFKPSRKLSASVSAGYLSRSPDEPTFKDVSGFDFAASVDWDLPNNLTTLGLNVSRSVNESTEADTAGLLSTNTSMTVQHALTRAIILNGGLTYARTEEEGGTGNTDTDTYGAELGASYNVNRRLSVGANYKYSRGVSSLGGDGFVNNVFALRAKFAL